MKGMSLWQTTALGTNQRITVSVISILFINMKGLYPSAPTVNLQMITRFYDFVFIVQPLIYNPMTIITV